VRLHGVRRLQKALRFHKAHASIAALLFFVELSIALFVDDAFVRPYLGDVLVIPLVYCAIATFVEVRPALLGAAVFAFACAVEFSQRHDLVTALGLEESRLARTVLGTSYSSLDLIAYAVGAALTVVVHRRAQRLRVTPPRA
jgi:hypothetical protein